MSSRECSTRARAATGAPGSHTAATGLPRRTGAITSLVSGLSGILMLVAAFAIAPLPPPHTASGASWSQVASVNPAIGVNGNRLVGIACPTAALCLAVGYSVTNTIWNSSFTNANLVEKYTGAAWSQDATITSPDAHGDQLGAIACQSATNCVAVGTLVDATGSWPVAETWNGVTWTHVIPPHPTGHTDTGGGLSGVGCASATVCYAVGNSYDAGGALYNLIYKDNSGVWTQMAAPNFSGASKFDYLNGVACPTATVCFAPGTFQNPNVHPSLLALGAGVWSAATPTPPGGESQGALNAISCDSATDCWLAGEWRTAVGSYTPMSYEWVGGVWTYIAGQTPAFNSGSYQWGISCTSTTACVTAGDYTNSAPSNLPGDATLGQFWNGTSWVDESGFPSPPGTPDPDRVNTATDQLFAVSCDSATDCWAVGYYDSPESTIIAHWTNGASLAPTVTAVAPTSGPAAGGTSVTITGTNFSATCASNTVKFGAATAATPTACSTTSLTAVSPAAAAGVVDITVTTAAGTSATSASDKFTYLAASTTTLGSSANPSVYGQSVTFTATVTGSAPTGTVTFKDGATTLGTGTLNGTFQAAYTTTLGQLATGSNSITAVYAGDSANAGSTSTVLTQTVNQAATTIGLVSAPDPSSAGQSVTLTATVTASAPGSGIPSGTVTFFVAGVSLGTGALNGSGQATLTTSALAVGTQIPSATYGGDPNYLSPASGAITEFTIPTASSEAPGIVAGPDGNLWITDMINSKIGKVTPAGAFTQYNPTTANSARGIAVGPDGNLWFTEYNQNKVAKVTPGGVFTEYIVPTGSSGPFRITAGPDGNMWFTENSANKIAKVTTLGVFTEYTVPTASAAPAWITNGPDGNLWFTENAASANKVAKVTTAGVFTEYTVPSASSAPQGIVSGPDGNLWFTEYSANKVAKVTVAGTFTEFTVPTGASNPDGITSGPDGMLWFVEYTGNKITSLTTGGVFTEHLIPTATALPWAVAEGPDGKVWFTESNTTKIGSITTGAAGTLQAVNPATSSTTLTSTINPSAVGQSVTFTATVSGPSLVTATKVFGQGGSFSSATPNNGGISATSLDQPTTVLPDGSGGTYVAEAANHRVLYYPAGTTTATRVYGQLGSFTSNTANNGGVNANTMTEIWGMALDGSGGLYLADTYNNRVLYYTSGSTTATRVYGQNGSFTTGAINQGGGPTATTLYNPNGITLDAAGNLYVADYLNNRVLFYPSGQTTPTKVYGQSGSFTTNGANSPGLNASSLFQPEGVTLDAAGNLYIADGANNRTLFFGAGTTTATRVYGQAGSFTTNLANSGGVTANTLALPVAVALDAAGTVYISDENNSRVLSYVGTSTTATAVFGQDGLFTNGSPNPSGVNAGSLSGPEGVTVDPAGWLDIADRVNNRVLEYPVPSGTVTFKDGATTLGTGALAAGTATYTTTALAGGTHSITAIYSGDPNYSASTSAPLTQTVNAPSTSTAVSSSANPAGFGQSVTFTATVSGAATETATRVYGQSGSFTTGGVNQGGVSADSLNWNHATAVDASGNSYVSDTTNNRVLFYTSGSTTASRVYGQGGVFTTNVGNNGGVTANSLSVPKGVTLDAGGNLYVADASNNRVLFYPSGSTTATRVYGQGGLFTTLTTNNGGLSATSLNQPAEVAVDPLGGIYISDFGNNRVLHYPGVSLTADRVYGQGGLFTTGTVNNGGITANSFNGPTSLALDPSGNLYVSDTFNNRVFYFATGSTTASRVYGQGGSFTSATANNGGVTASSLSEPHGVTLDLAGGLYISDKLNNRILYFPPGGGTVANRSLGQADVMTANAANGGGTISATGLFTPYRVGLAPDGSIYVDDSGNNRTLVFPGATITGSVTFQDAGTTIGSGTLSGGVATFATSTLATGTHPITAVYSGDGTNLASTSSVLSQVITAPTSATGVSTSGSPTTYDTVVTFTATVTFSGPIPSAESVTFCDGGSGGTACPGGVLLGTGAINSGTGVATYSTSVLSVATHTIVAYYPSDGTYPASNGTVAQVVNAGTLTVAAPGPVSLPLTPGTTSAATNLGTVSFTNALGDQTAWSVTLGATDLCKAGVVGMPFSKMSISVDPSPTGGSGAVGILTPGSAVQPLSGVDSTICTTFSSGTALLASGTANSGDNPGTAGTWTMANNKLSVVSLGTANAGSYTGTIQYTITG